MASRSPKTVQPKTVQPKTVQPKTVQPKTVQSNTTRTWANVAAGQTPAANVAAGQTPRASQSTHSSQKTSASEGFSQQEIEMAIKLSLEEDARQKAIQQEADRQQAASREYARQKARREIAADEAARREKLAQQAARKEDVLKKRLACQEADPQEEPRQVVSYLDHLKKVTLELIDRRKMEEAAQQEKLGQEEYARQKEIRQEKIRQEFARLERLHKEKEAHQAKLREEAAHQEKLREEDAQRKKAAAEEYWRQYWIGVEEKKKRNIEMKAEVEYSKTILHEIILKKEHELRTNFPKEEQTVSKEEFNPQLYLSREEQRKYKRETAVNQQYIRNMSDKYYESFISKKLLELMPDYYSHRKFSCICRMEAKDFINSDIRSIYYKEYLENMENVYQSIKPVCPSRSDHDPDDEFDDDPDAKSE
jgi:hypothetical protein